MTAEWLVGLLLAAQAAPATAARDSGREELHARDRLLTQLFELQRRVRAGELPAPSELAAGRTAREQLLAGLDVRRAVQLGFEPRALRDRLLPAFLLEFEQLEAQRTRRDLGPPAEASPLLTMVLDLEQDFWREADRRRQRMGLKSPLDTGPLSQRLQPEAAPGRETADPVGAAPGARANAAAAALPPSADPQFAGQVHYRAGRYADALALWEPLSPPAGDAGLAFSYQRADCLMRTERVDDAIAAWERLAADHPGTRWAAQAEFALKVARALKACRDVRAEATGGKP